MKIFINILFAFSLICSVGYGTNTQFSIISDVQAADCVASVNGQQT